jgi:hypothetical protein
MDDTRAVILEALAAVEDQQHRLQEVAVRLRSVLGVDALAYLASSEQDDWISLVDAEKEFRVRNKTVRRWASSLALGRKDERGHWRLSRSAVHAYLARNRRG